MSEIANTPDEAPGWTGQDFAVRDDTMQELEDARPENTRRAYRRNWADFAQWCAERGRVALPATPQTLLEYVRDRKDGAWYPGPNAARTKTAEAKLPSPASLAQIIATIQSAHRTAGYPGRPGAENARDLLKAYSRAWADAGNRVRRAIPISPDHLRALVRTCDTRTMAGLRDRSLLLLGMTTGRRASTLAGLRIQDIASAGEDGMTVYVRYSKTDQAGRGEEVNVPFSGQHGLAEETCAPCATWAWLAAIRERGVTEGPLYQRVDAWDRLGCEPGVVSGVGLNRRGGHLDTGTVTSIVRRHHHLAGLPVPGFLSGHSLRAGAVTSALAARAPVQAVAEQYGFADGSIVLNRYNRAVDRIENNPAKLTGL